MNGIIKSIAVVAVISFCLSACGGESSGETTGTMPSGGGLSTALLSDAAKRGHDIYVDPTYSCNSCHGLQGKGTNAGGPIDNIQDCPTCAAHATLTQYNDLLMPAAPYSPASCAGACASDVSQFIIEGFVQGLAIPGGNNTPAPAAPAVNVTPTSGLITTEAGGMASFTVVLNTMPTDNVDITLASSNVNEGNVNPATLTFTPADWNQLQTVMVTGMDDALLDGNVTYTIMTTTASNDLDYAAIPTADVEVTNTDDEVPPPGVVTVNPTTGLVTTEDGGTATFTIVLGTQPTADVSIGLSSSNAAEGTVLPASVVFNAGNYNVVQTVTVTGVNDIATPVVDGNIAYSVVTAAAVSADPSYSGFAVDDVSVTNNDNDVQPVISAFTVDTASIAYGGMITLNWASDADACTAGGANPGNQWMGALLPTSMLTLTNLTTSGVNQFTLTCTKGGIASAVATVDVTVAAAPGAPTVNLSANPAMNVPYAGSTTLTWTSTGAVGTCTAAGGWAGADKALNGSEQIDNLIANTAFELTCVNSIGTSTTVNTNVTVVPANPALAFTVNNAATAAVDQGDSVTLTWNPTDLASCTASANPANAAWTGAKGVAQATYTEVIANLQETTTFTLNCAGINAANVTQSVTATVNAADPALVQGQIEYKKVVNGASCETCHGAQGQGGTDKAIAGFQAGNLANIVFYLNLIMPTMENGVGGMPSDCADVADGNFLTDCATNVAKYMENGYQVQ